MAEARAGAEMGTGTQASRTVLKIRCKSSLEYLGTSIATAGAFGPRDSADCLENSDLEGGEESERATEGYS